MLHYDIEFDVDRVANAVSALSTIGALATQDMSAFNLDLSGLEVHAVTVDGADAEFSRSGNELTVRPEFALVQGQEFSVGVRYSGMPEPIDDPGVPFIAVGWRSRDGVIFTLSQPSGAMTWFPSNNHPSDKATFELRITVPESTTAAATGLLVNQTTAAGRTASTWRMDDPMATYLAALENQTLPVHGPETLHPAMIAHEAAHQWLGNSVAVEDWGDIWLNEGFATYLHMMFDAEHGGADFADFDAGMRQMHAELPSIAPAPPGTVSIDELFGPSVYLRGAMTLHALRIHAGDKTFFEILRAHYERSAGGTTNTDEFLGIVHEFAGPEAVAVVESWLLDDTVPDLPLRRPS